MAQRKPKINLSELEKTAVNTPTQEDYNTLMRVLECGEWIWCDKSLPTEDNIWKQYKEQTCIRAENEFGFGSKEYYGRKRRNIITTQEFYDKQKISPEMIKEINNYFEKIK